MRATVQPANQEADPMALGAAVALATERVITSIEGMHRAIAGRWFTALGPAVKPARVLHDAGAGFVYRSVRLGGAALGIGIDAGRANQPGTDDSIQAIINGLWGDRLGRHENRLAIAMGIRDRDGEPVPIDLATSAAFPGATGRLVVLVHGLVETERCWRGNPTEPGLAETLEADSDLTPVSIRYNTGLRISTNGSHLATLLEEIYSSWPVAVESFALVGHSMGGLVVRSACVAARESGHRWIDTVTDVVTLGSPHAGAPLERGVNAAAWGLSMAAETRPLADFLNARSAGIKDLRYGAIAETDWRDIDPDELLTDTVDDHPLPPAIDHHFVAGVITADPTHPVGVAVGDLIVPAASGTGKQRFEPANAVVIGGMRHRDLLREPAVIDHVMAWLAPEAVADRDSASA